MKYMERATAPALIHGLPLPVEAEDDTAEHDGMQCSDMNHEDISLRKGGSGGRSHCASGRQRRALRPERMEDVVQVEEPVRCLEHCKYGQQNVSLSAPADFTAGVMVALFEAPPLTVTEPPAMLVQSPLLARITSPPEYARSQRLRI